MFKLDWTSVWRAVVPYRDPNLLPRQWRIAIGTQKSYKADSAKRERHRIYELKRRRAKATAMNNSITGSEKEVICLHMNSLSHCFFDMEGEKHQSLFIFEHLYLLNSKILARINVSLC